MSVQPELPAINAQEELPFEEAAAAERHLQLVPNAVEAQDAEAPENLGHNIQWSNEAIAEGDIPNASTLANMSKAASEIITTDDGNYTDAAGNVLDKDQTEEFLHNAEPNNWILNKEDQAGYQAVSEAKAAGQLTADQKKEMYGMQTRDDVPVEKAFAAYRDAANKRLATSEELKNILGEDKTYESDKEEGIGDIVNIAKNGRGQRDGNKFISKQNMEQIEANQDQIREGLDEWTTARENGEVTPLRPDFADRNAIGRGRRENGKFMTDEQADMVDENTEQIYAGLPELEKAREENEAEASDAEAQTDSQEALTRPDSIDAETWDQLSREDQEAMVEMIGLTAEADAEATADAEANPATAKPRGIRGRVQKRMDNAMKRIINLKNATREYFGDEEKGKRRKIIGVTAGALATAYAIHKGMDGNSGGTETVTTPTEAATAAAPAAAEVSPVVTETLSKGGTVWAMAREHLGGDPTNAQIFSETQRLLDLNGISWEEARKLASGTKIKI